MSETLQSEPVRFERDTPPGVGVVEPAAAVHVFACWRSDRHGALFCRWTPPRGGALDAGRFVVPAIALGAALSDR